MKKPIYKKWWFWVILVLLIIGIGGASGSDDTAAPDNSAANQTQQENNSAVEPEQPSEPEEVTYKVGDTAVAKSYTLAIEDLKVIDSGNQFIGPDDGNIFVEIPLTLENTSTSDIAVSSLLCFAAYVDDYSMTEDLTARTCTDLTSMDGTVGAGKKMKGSLCYQVPEDWKEIQIEVDLGFSSKDEISIVIVNE